MGHDTLRLVEHGEPARRALAEVIAAEKGTDALAPVTVAVPHLWAGLSLRRALAAEAGGVANVRFGPLASVAELVAARGLMADEMRPLTPTVARAAVRSVLRSAPGEVLAAVADHPATEAAVVRLVDELAAVGAEGRRRLARAGGRRADLAGVAERVMATTPHRYDRHGLVRAAAAAVRREGVPAGVGHVVVHLPAGVSPAELELLSALASAGALTVLLGHTGDPSADAPARRLQRRLEAALGVVGAEPPASPTPPVATRALTVTDPDDEARAALRAVVERWHDDTSLERMAIAYPVREPYARLLREQADAAGIPVVAPSTATLATSVVGRTLLDALGLHDTGLGRDSVIAWVASAPMRHPDGRRIPSTRWDILSRRAGVVGGDVEHWRRHLDAAVEQTHDDEARVRRDDDPSAAHERFERERLELVRLGRFVEWIDAEIRELRELPTWSDMARWCRRLLRTLLGREASWAGSWPATQAEAGRDVLEALERLAALDDVEPSPDLATFRRALGAELEAGAGRTGEFGRGLVLTPLRHAVALDLDLLVVVGVAEGTLPGRTTDDALLRDTDRALVDPDLPRRADTVAEQHHALLGAMAGARERVLVAPRGDLRQGRARLPSRWFPRDGVGEVPSFAAGLADARVPVSSAERDLADLLSWSAGGRRLTEHALTRAIPALRTGFEVIGARRRGFNRFSGDLEGAPVPNFRDGASLSPTALERWATCPRRYLFSQVLRLRAQERPEVIDRVVATDRGALVHEVLERFYAEVVARPEPKAPDEPWTPDERARLHEILDDVGARYQQRGLTGRQVLWNLDRADIARDLERFLDHDERYRRLHRAHPIDTELPFGPEQPTQAGTDLPGERRVWFRGYADRVDRTAEGGLIVLDYKTGKLAKDVREIETGDPVVRGTKLQLPVYALAAAAAHGSGDVPVRAAYWFISDAGRYAQIGYEATAERDARFVEALTTIADGIEDGVFPARPGKPSDRDGHANCRFCDFDSVCGNDRAGEWDAVRLAPRLAGLRALTGDAETDESTEEGAP